MFWCFVASVADFVAKTGSNYSDQFKNLEKLVTDVDKEIILQLYGSSKPARWFPYRLV